MKVVVNRCFGGFSISLEAARYMAERGSRKAKAEIDDYERRDKLVRYWRSNNHTYPEGTRPSETEYLHPEYDFEPHWFGYGYTGDDVEGYERGDPLLIEAVEVLGDKASGEMAQLEVVEIPDGIDWYIDDYDGMEKVCEKHREW